MSKNRPAIVKSSIPDAPSDSLYKGRKSDRARYAALSPPRTNASTVADEMYTLRFDEDVQDRLLLLKRGAVWSISSTVMVGVTLSSCRSRARDSAGRSFAYCLRRNPDIAPRSFSRRSASLACMGVRSWAALSAGVLL